MEKQTFEALFCEIMQKNGLERYCAEPFLPKFASFLELFFAENAKTNLSAIRTPAEAIAKHLADCLLAESLFPQGAAVLDVGCGGGFPSFPLAIARTDLQITAIDSTKKKVDFVSRTAGELGLNHLKAVCGRVEAPEQAQLRGKFDVVTGRAVANLRVFAELTLPFMKTGGLMIAFKGAQGAEELDEAQNAIRTLGGVPERDLSCSLFCPILQPDGTLTGYQEEKRHLLIIRKQKLTPPQYPRAYAAILKRPL